MSNLSEQGVLLSLKNKVAVITGGSRGIGAATVRMFRRAGARVVFNYVTAEEQASALVGECGGDAHCVAVRQRLEAPEDGHALIAKAVEPFGRVDCCVANHGIWPPHDQPFETMTGEQWRTTMGVNLDGVFGVVQAAAAQMLRQESVSGVRGHIVLVSSTAGQRGEAFHADYAATKGALISLTKSLSTEMIARGVYVNCVAPGWVATEMTRDVLARPESKKLLSLIPLGRPADVDEIAGPILFLCTPLAGFISGEIFNVNGGAVLVG